MPTNTLGLMFNDISNKQFSIKRWIKYCICPCKGAAAITGLAYTQWFVDIAVVQVLITYFIGTSREEEDKILRHAVALANILDGLSSVMVFPMIYISENHVIPLKVILCSVAAYIIGMVVLCISIFYTKPGVGVYVLPAVLLISVGKAGGLPILEGFLVDQLTTHEPKLQEKDEGRVKARKTVYWTTASLLCKLSTPWIFDKATWKVTFVTSTSVMGFGYLLFLCCIPLYHPRSVDEALTTAEISLASIEENTNNGPVPADSAGRSSLVDEVAATSEFSRVRPEKKTNNGPTTVQDSAGKREKRKAVKIMIPMWTTFLVFGLVLSAGDTFFIAQGNFMHATVSIYVVIMIGKVIKHTSSLFSGLLLEYCIPKPLKPKGIIVGIWTALVVSVICCYVAWRVEIRRLRVIEESGFCQNDEPDFPMSIIRLAPQFCLLGLMEGIGTEFLDLFFDVQVPDIVPMETYGSALNEAVIGIGSFLNALLVNCIKSWFGEDLECSSHLDKYYRMLMILGSVNVGIYMCVSTFYWNKPKKNDAKVEETGAGAI